MANVSKISDGTTTYDISSVTVKNQNSLGNSLKMWSGTKAQYDAIVTKDSNTLYNITDDANGSQNIYNKAEVDTLLNNKANINLSNVSLMHLISFETDGTQWCKKYSNGWCEQFCVYSQQVSLQAHGGSQYIWPLYQNITTFISGHASIGGDCSVFAADVFSNNSSSVNFWLYRANTADYNGTLTGKYYVQGWL